MLPTPVGQEWAATHAALPTLERVDGDRARILFSGRDAQGRASIGRADVSLAGGPPDVHPEPVLLPGPLGAFDDAGVTTSCLVEHEGRLHLYYTGWSLGVSVPFYFYGGCAVSADGGATFERASAAPVLERNGVDPYLTASPWVMVEDGRWRMWYVSATGWERAGDAVRHRYHIRYAESADGLAWDRDGRVCIDFAGPDEYALSRPCVVKEGDRYRMWFAARGDRYRIHRADSADGVDWTRIGEVQLDGESEGWDAEMQAYPLVVGRWMLYNGNDYGRTGIGLAVRSS